MSANSVQVCVDKECSNNKMVSVGADCSASIEDSVFVCVILSLLVSFKKTKKTKDVSLKQSADHF